jgi:Fic-DOC domain mobile mystery protein B
MTELHFTQYATGATPLDPDEAAGLIPAHIATQDDLNAWEQANIIAGEDWLRRQLKRKVAPSLLSEGFMRDLHKAMFSRTWRWAGTFRQSNKNIGVDWTQVAVRLRNLLDNTQYQINHTINDTINSAASNGAALDEIIIRFHHQLVWIHPFPNGNGRHSRLAADALLMQLGLPRFSWGAISLVNESLTRSAYLNALRQADAGQMAELLAFARS